MSDDEFAPSPEHMPPSFPPSRVPAHRENTASAHDADTPEPEPVQAPKGSWLRSLGELFGVIVAALVISVLIKTFLVQAFWVPSESMETTLMPGDRIAVTRIDRSDVHRGDVVVFLDPGGWLDPTTEDSSTVRRAISDVLQFVGLLPQNTGQHLVKRVIGVGGDTVACEGNGAPITVNGVAIDETYLADGMEPSESAFSVTVPEGYLWVMGDNRSDSADSRYHQAVDGNGFVPVANVVGKAWGVFYPFSRFGALPDVSSVFAEVDAK